MSAGEIKVKRAEFGIPEITSGKDKQDGIKIAGDFTVDFTGNTLSFTPTDNSSTKVIAKLSQYKPVSNEGEITIYMPVRPFKAVEGTCVEVSLNGSSKMVKLTEDVNFEAGKVTTLRVTIPTLKGTLSSAITKNGTTFVDWGENTSYDQVSINGTEGIDLYTVNNGQITISGKISEFLGTETGNGVLPLSFFASSKVSIDDSGSIISSPATLSLNSLYVNVINVADVLIEGSALEESIGINVTFNPVLLGDYGIENIIIIDEERAHYSIDEDKANRLIKDGLAGSEKFNKRTIHTDIKATDYDLALFRSAMFKMDQAAWEKLFKLAQVMAPGQFSEYNKQDDTLLGKLLRGCADSSWKGGIYRGTVAVAISLATMEVTLITNGEVAMWGMNIYGGE
jgi:hypothetical protein